MYSHNRRLAFALILAAAVPALAQLQRPRVIILIGPPGSGKTIQSNALQKRFKIPAISMAQVLEESGRKTPVGKSLAASFESGDLIADGPANELMRTRLTRRDAGNGFILDGYPVSEGQAKALDELLVQNQFPKPTIVILDVPEDVVRQRLLKRGRADDKPENIDRRLREYREVGRLVEKWYGSGTVVRVNGTATPQEVATRIADGIETAGHTGKELKVRPPQEQGLKQRPPDAK